LKLKKTTALLCCMILLISGTTGCTRGKEAAKTDRKKESKTEIVWRVHLPISEKDKEIIPDKESWSKQIDKILEKENKNYKVEVAFFYDPDDGEPADLPLKFLKECRDKGSKTDVITVLSGRTNMADIKNSISMYPSCAENDIFLPLDEILSSTKGDKVRAVIPKTDLDYSKINNITYGLSATQPTYMGTAYSKDILDQCNIQKEELSQNIFENEEILKKVKTITGIAPYRIYSAYFVPEILGYWIQQPCQTLGYGPDHEFINVTETEEYKQYMNKLFNWKKSGLLDTICDKENGIEGTAFATPLHMYGLDNYRTDPYEITIPTGSKEETFYIIPDTGLPYMAPYFGDNKVGISSWTKNKDYAFDFMEELLTNKELANFLQFGEEGKDYSLNGNNQIQLNKQSSNVITRHFGYQYTNPLITLPTEVMSQDKLTCASDFKEKFYGSLPKGFRFDFISLAKEIQDCNNVYKEYTTEKTGGIPNPTANQLFSLNCENVEQTIDELNRQLNSAGMDKIIEAANKQLDDWKAAKDISSAADSK